MKTLPKKWEKKIGREWNPEFVISSGSLALDNSPALSNYKGIPSGTMVHVYSDGEGAFKCHPKGTKVLMYNGLYKDVSELKIGDQLMGPDSNPRNILSVGTGKEMCYRVDPIKGESWECNESHILHLIGSCGKYKGKTFNITVKEWLNKSKWFKRNNLLYRPNGIEFKEKSLPIDPYLLGLWLGDGTSSKKTPEITNIDKEVVNWLKKWCIENNFSLNECGKIRYSISDPNCRCQPVIQKNKKGNIIKEFSSLTEAGKSRDANSGNIYRWINTKYNDPKGYIWENKRKKYTTNKLTKSFEKLNLFNNKHIPHIYKISSRKQRLRLLAGLIDSDGTYSGSSKVNYSISQSNYYLCEDIAFIARSLGFTGNIYKYKNRKYNTPFWHISICGDTDKIPVKIKRKKSNPRKQRKNHLRTGFKVEPIGEKKYYGFQLDGDQLYLLKDFTVTHNSSLCLQGASNIQKDLGKKIVMIDAEHGITGLEWIKQLGVLTDKDHWIYCYPESGEEAFEMTEFFLQQDDVGGVIVDSIDGIVPQKQLDAEFGDADIGTQAKLVTRAIRKFKGLVRTHQKILWLVNQKKINLTAMGAMGTKPTGGRGINFYCKLNLDMRKNKSDNSLKGEDIIPLTISVKRSKLGQSYIDVPTYGIQGYGIDQNTELKDFAVDQGLIYQAGSWWKEGDETIGQGLEAIKSFCVENRDRILKNIREE